MNTLFLRLEGALQAWDHNARFVVRTTMQEPTKSGVVGLICACAGLDRENAQIHLPIFNALKMGVRVDKPGTVISDYQTIGASNQMMTASGEPTFKTEETIREYLSDASFLVALQGDEKTLAEVANAVKNPVFTPYLGRRCCVPSRKLYEGEGDYADLKDALTNHPWRPRSNELPPETCRCVFEVEGPEAVRNMYREQRVVRKDVLVSLIPHVFGNRIVQFGSVQPVTGERVYPPDLAPVLERQNQEKWRQTRAQRLVIDNGSCVVCKLAAQEVHHITYERYNNELMSDLRSLCKICHKIVSGIEYGENLSQTARLDPLIPEVRQMVLEKRKKFLENQ